MNKKYLLLTLACTLAMLISAAPARATNVPAGGIPNLNEFYVASIGMPYTVDPGACYDTASAEIIMNVYDQLVWFNWESASAYVPQVATSWALKGTPNAGYDHTWVFTIRANMKWQDFGTSGDYVTPADVEYSFERWMAMDISGGPQWMIYEALLGVTGHDDTWSSDTNNPIAKAVQVVGNTVEFNFVNAYPDDIFFQVIAQSWAAILDKDWCLSLNTAGRNIWDGNWANWKTYIDPPVPPLDDPSPIMMGSGPYKLDYIDYIQEKWRITRFVDYWEGWPAPGCSDYVDAYTMSTVNLWADRKLLLLSDNPAAQADEVAIPRANINDPDLLNAISANPPKVRFIKDMPGLRVDAFFFNFNIPSNSPYAGDFNWGTGIPANFFADKNVRYAFAHSFNWPQYITQVMLGEATQPATPHILGLGYDDVYAALNDASKYSYDPVKAKQELQAAHGGALWNNGFKLTITYNTGNTARQTVCQMLEANIEAFNADRPGKTPFDITVLEVPWSTYISDLYNVPYYKTKMTIFVVGWLADYPDPHNFWFPFFHSDGDYTYFQSYSNATVDAKIELEITQTVHSARASTFGDLFGLFKAELPSVPTVQPKVRHYERTWVQNWYYNTIEPGLYVRRIWKGLDGDVNNDQLVSIADAGQISAHWSPGPPVGPAGYNRAFDISPELSYPHTDRVDILDAAYINAWWGSHNP